MADFDAAFTKALELLVAHDGIVETQEGQNRARFVDPAQVLKAIAIAQKVKFETEAQSNCIFEEIL